MISAPVNRLRDLGPLPAEGSVVPDVVSEFEQAIRSIKRPVTNDEARVLVTLFGPDGCFGLALALIRLIESAPGWPMEDLLADPQNEWVQELRDRVERGR